MAYEQYCGSCTYLGESADCYGRYFVPRKMKEEKQLIQNVVVSSKLTAEAMVLDQI